MTSLAPRSFVHNCRSRPRDQVDQVALQTGVSLLSGKPEIRSGPVTFVDHQPSNPALRVDFEVNLLKRLAFLGIKLKENVPRINWRDIGDHLDFREDPPKVQLAEQEPQRDAGVGGVLDGEAGSLFVFLNVKISVFTIGEKELSLGPRILPAHFARLAQVDDAGLL